MQGTFIVLEGPDGSGTSTHTKRLAERLRNEGHDVVLTAEPTDGPIGRFIREQLAADSVPSPSALQLLFCADRALHIEEVIKPALEAGKTVISDRYVISTLVYGEAMGLRPDWLLQVNTPFIEPDKMILALPPLHVCLERIGMREKLDVFENAAFQKKIYDLYEAMSDDPQVQVVDTSGNIESAAERVYEAVM